MFARGRLRPATEFGRPGSGSNHIMPLLSSTPVPGATTRLPHAVSNVWVIATTLPALSAVLRCVVLPSFMYSETDGARSWVTPSRSFVAAVSYTHLRAHETDSYLVCRL